MTDRRKNIQEAVDITDQRPDWQRNYQLTLNLLNRSLYKTMTEPKDSKLMQAAKEIASDLGTNIDAESPKDVRSGITPELIERVAKKIGFDGFSDINNRMVMSLYSIPFKFAVVDFVMTHPDFRGIKADLSLGDFRVISKVPATKMFDREAEVSWFDVFIMVADALPPKQEMHKTPDKR